ncbi:unnamed protein product [Bursaphelenchus okinawaensis]|uniref:Protein kinase domain-containing protein n=1 Tax=Bursaphelenchus okinawaensis TaxID=465554 RepID=A0A811KEJ4_9BILA|nr:unnamed protein product [Bursaphelenchus okinawaensis]CAG9102213.1 unnamed protein product [Bursaphelenchus okinawaensis]
MIPGNDKNVGYSSPNMIDVAASPGAESPNLPPEIGQSKFYENIHLDIFHGPMDKEDIALVLNNNGEYLIANGFVDIKSKLGVWIKWADQLTFYPVIEDIEQGTCTFNGLVAKPNLTELLAHHDTTQQPITTAPDGPKLMYGIKKQSWELDHKNVKTEKELGSGAFGTVYLGSLFRNGQWIPAAIKVPRLDKAKKEAQTAEFLQEARIQRDYLHVNIVRLFGVATNGPDILIVLEYVNGGDLLSYVKKNPHLNVTMRLAFCFDVASGMAYLHKIQCLHRDMAARNCLVVQSPCYCKITDFGLSAKGLNQAVSKTKSVPIRWIAPEVIKTGTYEAASDVWSLGVMFWEVYTFCKDLPYAKIKELKEVQVQLKSNPNFRPDMAKKAEPPL